MPFGEISPVTDSNALGQQRKDTESDSGVSVVKGSIFRRLPSGKQVDVSQQFKTVLSLRTQLTRPILIEVAPFINAILNQCATIVRQRLSRNGVAPSKLDECAPYHTGRQITEFLSGHLPDICVLSKRVDDSMVWTEEWQGEWGVHVRPGLNKRDGEDIAEESSGYQLYSQDGDEIGKDEVKRRLIEIYQGLVEGVNTIQDPWDPSVAAIIIRLLYIVVEIQETQHWVISNLLPNDPYPESGRGELGFQLEQELCGGLIDVIWKEGHEGDVNQILRLELMVLENDVEVYYQITDDDLYHLDARFRRLADTGGSILDVPGGSLFHICHDECRIHANNPSAFPPPLRRMESQSLGHGEVRLRCANMAKKKKEAHVPQNSPLVGLGLTMVNCPNVIPLKRISGNSLAPGEIRVAAACGVAARRFSQRSRRNT